MNTPAPTPLPASARSALIVVDMQNGFVNPKGSCASTGFPVAELAPAIAPCRTAIDVARRARVPIVFTRYTYRADFRDGGFMLKEKFPMLADANALVAGSWDQALLDELGATDSDFLIDKNRPSSFYGTPLESYLKGLGVEEVVICGVTTQCCVETTVRDAAQRDFRTFVLSDAVAEWNKEQQASALATMGMLFAHLITTADLNRAWQ
ncbi:MAG: cysteine hydrolase [Pseudomonadales bacterium]|nr:cysteine hydrolase [Pseudomonadales bacterium]